MELSNYRLGDLIYYPGLFDNNLLHKIIKDYPDSFATKYIIYQSRNHQDNLTVITNIVLDFIKNNKHLLPDDIQDSTVIHLRLGDVIAGNTWHEKLKRPLDVNDMKELLVNDTNKKYVIGKQFYCDTSSTNYNECSLLSIKYLNEVLTSFNAIHLENTADIDLCCGVMAKQFFQGRGYFSKLIAEIRKKLNLPVIETLTETK
jgi:hypothetical protein